MAIDFPTATTVGQTYTDPTSGNTYVVAVVGPPAQWVGSGSSTNLDATYLRKDASNDPVTGTLTVTPATNVEGLVVTQPSGNSAAAMRITNEGTGNSLVVEDSANPDSTPFTIDNAGNLTATAAGPHAFGMMPNLYTAATRATTNQYIGDLATLVFNNELKDPYGLYNNTTGVFTVTAAHTGVYLIIAGLYVYSLQSPSGESTFLAGIYKNDTTALQYQEIWETTNPDETFTGMTISTIAQLNSNGDNVRLKGHIIGSSGAEQLMIDSSLTILRLY